MVFRKFSEITKNKQIFSQNNIFYSYEYFFFQSAFWSLSNHRHWSQSNQEQCRVCCSCPCFLVLLCTHYRPLQCFSTKFRKLKEIGVLRSIFPDYIISCDYFLIKPFWESLLKNNFFFNAHCLNESPLTFICNFYSGKEYLKIRKTTSKTGNFI